MALNLLTYMNQSWNVAKKLEILQKTWNIAKKLEILQKKFQQVRITRTKNGLDEALSDPNVITILLLGGESDHIIGH